MGLHREYVDTESDLSTPQDGELVLSLRAGGPRELLGGKGAALAELISAGFPVPPGFCISARAYTRFVEENGLSELIVDTLEQSRGTAPEQLVALSERVEAAFQRGRLPADLVAAMTRAHRDLGTQLPLAVRSSAIDEDGTQASLAGQHRSVLDVRGIEGLLAAVRSCWASLFSAEALAYRSTSHPREGLAMAVVVQELLAPTRAGVLFTAHPVSGARDELVIEMSEGLGAALAAGEVTPRLFLLDRSTLELKSAQGQGPTLSAHELRALGALGARVEALYSGAPQDIEWAEVGDTFWVLQARPITNLASPPAKVRWEPPIPGSGWVRRQVAEHLPDPLSPLFAELYVGEGLDRAMSALQRAMGVPSAIAEDMLQRPYFATVNGYAYLRGDMRLRPLSFPLLVFASLFQLVRQRGITLWRDEGLPRYQAEVARWRARPPRELSDVELVDGVRALAWADALYWAACTPAIATAKIADAWLTRFLSRAGFQELAQGELLRGVGSEALEADAELARIAGAIRALPELHARLCRCRAEEIGEELAVCSEGRPVQGALDEYFERYGHRIYNLDFAEPTQVEVPLPVWWQLRRYLEGPPVDLEADLRALADLRASRIERVACALGPIRRRFFSWLVRWALRVTPQRETALFFLGAAWPTLRRLALELGRRAVERGVLRDTDDVFYLETREIEEALAAPQGEVARTCAEIASARRTLRREQRRLHPPVVVPEGFRYRLGPFDLSGQEGQRRNAPDAQVLEGFAVSSGRVTAQVSVLHSVSDFRSVKPGTILVCATATPALTPLFGQARGLITDIGGVLAHGSIVVREYGIPAVMGTGSATQRLSTGQWVTLDGDAGTVTLSPTLYPALEAQESDAPPHRDPI